MILLSEIKAQTMKGESTFVLIFLDRQRTTCNALCSLWKIFLFKIGQKHELLVPTAKFISQIK